MGMQKEHIENLTPDNSAQCDMCNHLFLNKHIREYQIKYLDVFGTATIRLCRSCASKWFNLVNKDSLDFETKDIIYPDNLDEIQ